MFKRRKNTPKDKMREGPLDQESLPRKYPNMNQLLSEEPGASPWFQRQSRQAFTTRKGVLTWSHSNDELFLLNSDGDVVGIVRNGTIVKQVDSGRLLVSYETRYLNRKREDPDNTNSLDISVVGIDDLKIIRDFRAEALSLKKQQRQFALYGSLDAHCAVRLKVSEGVHSFAFPEGLKLVDEILHVSEYLPLQRLPDQFEVMALFVLRPKKDEYEVFPQDWYNLEGWDSMYMFPDKAVRDPISGRIFVRGIRIGDMVLDVSNRMSEMR